MSRLAMKQAYLSTPMTDTDIQMFGAQWLEANTNDVRCEPPEG